MKYLAYIILIQFITIHFIQSQDLSDGKNPSERIGAVEDKITLDHYQDFYLFNFKDISPAEKDEEKNFEISTKDDLTNFQQSLLDGFNKEIDNPSTFETEKFEFRMYYKNRSIRKDYVEVIVENKRTEETSTLPWLTKAAIKQLFNIKQ